MNAGGLCMVDASTVGSTGMPLTIIGVHATSMGADVAVGMATRIKVNWAREAAVERISRQTLEVCNLWEEQFRRSDPFHRFALAVRWRDDSSASHGCAAARPSELSIGLTSEFESYRPARSPVGGIAEDTDVRLEFWKLSGNSWACRVVSKRREATLHGAWNPALGQGSVRETLHAE